MKKKTALIACSVILIILIAMICLCQKSDNSSDENILEKYILSKEYKYLVLESAHSGKENVYAEFSINPEGIRLEEDFANDLKQLKNDMEYFLQHNYSDALPLVPDVKIAVLNDDVRPVTIYMTNHSTIYSNAPVYYAHNLKIECGFFTCRDMSLSSLGKLNGFKFLQFSSFQGTDYVNTLQCLDDLQYLNIWTDENVNDIDINKLQEQHPNCKIDIKQE